MEKELVLRVLLKQREELTNKLFEPSVNSVMATFDDFIRKERDLLDEFILKVMTHSSLGADE